MAAYLQSVIVSLEGEGKNDRGDRHKPAARIHGKCSGTSRG